MSPFLHTMVRITDPDKSRAFYEALGMEFRRESPIVRNGENYGWMKHEGYFENGRARGGRFAATAAICRFRHRK